MPADLQEQSPPAARVWRSATARRRAAIWALSLGFSIVVLLASLEFMRRQGLDPRAWLAEVWVLIAAIPLPFVVVALLLKTAEVALNALAWTVVLRAALPARPIAYRQTLGVVQGGVGIFAVIPPKFGGFAVLGLYRAIFPTIPLTTMLATRVVQGISSTILGTLVLVAFGVVTAGIGEQSGFLDSLLAFSSDQPLLAVVIAAALVGLVAALLHHGRDWLRGLVAQLTLAGAILRRPRRYAFLVVLPTLLAFVLRWGVTATLLAAFTIPVTWETLLRVNVSHGLARSVQVTPGGIGTTQAFDLVALQGAAPIETIVAYSLSQSAILFVFNLAFGMVALIWALGWERTAQFLRLPGRTATPTAPAAPHPSVG